MCQEHPAQEPLRISSKMPSEPDEVAAVSSPEGSSLTASKGPLRTDAESELEATGAVEDTENTIPGEDDFHPGLRLWIIILGLGVTLLLTALENTVVSVAMPYIISDLGIGDDYIWITNAFFICRCVKITVDMTLKTWFFRNSPRQCLSPDQHQSSPGI